MTPICISFLILITLFAWANLFFSIAAEPENCFSKKRALLHLGLFFWPIGLTWFLAKSIKAVFRKDSK